MPDQQEFRECLRCKWKWVSRNFYPPTYCPRCKSYKWNVAKTQNEPVAMKYKKYDFSKIEIGQEIKLPWLLKEDGSLDGHANNNRALGLAQFSRRSGRKFYRYANTEGLFIKRIA